MTISYPILAVRQENGLYQIRFPDFPEPDMPMPEFFDLSGAMDYAKVYISTMLRGLQKTGEPFPRPSSIQELDFGEDHPVAVYILIFPEDLKEDTYWKETISQS
jgi:hypothetical protein